MNPTERSPAKQLILDALHLDRALPDAAAVARMSAEDWDEFSGLAKMHRLGPMLHHRLARGEFAEAIPRNVRNRLKAVHRRHALRNLDIYRELVAVTRILEAGGVVSIALKGAFLARFAYPEPGLRPMRDLDLLLRPEQAVAAFELLREQGYQSLFDGAPEAYFADRKHLPPLIGSSGISIELHHRLTYPASPLAFEDDFVEAIWRRSLTKRLGNMPVRFFCPEDMLLYLCIHATMEHLLNLGPLMLADVALLVKARPVDWGRFLDDVSGGNWQRCVLPVLSLARRHLGAGIPDEVIRALGGGEEEAAWLAAAEYLLFSDPEDHKLLDFDMQEVLYTGSLSRRFSALAGAVFPPRTTIARHFPVSAGSPAAYLYYPVRWHRMITGKLPSLLKAHAGRKQSMRELAAHRNALSGWLKDSV
jgi:hypothetical protein